MPVKTSCGFVIVLVFLSLSGAETALAAEITDQIQYPEYWLEEGVAHYTLHNYDRALLLIDNALSQDPTLASGWMWRGRVLSQLGRIAEAQESAAKARELDPLIDEPFKKKAGALAELEITPVPTARPVQTEDKLKEMIQSDVDVSKKPDPTGPDMVMYDLQATLLPDSRQVAIQAVIGNEGVKPSRDFFITFYGSYQTPVTSADHPIGFYLVSNLLPGTKKTISGFFPVSQIPSGAYYIGAYIDPNNEVMEISEDNNGKTAATLVDVPEVNPSEGSQLGNSQLAVPRDPVTEPISNLRADLMVDEITFPPEAVLGDSIPVTTRVKNTGDEDAGSFRLMISLSRDRSISDDDVPLGYGDISDLASGKGRDGTASVTIPLNIIPGSYFLIANADSQGKIREHSKENNILVGSEPLLVRTLDLNQTLNPDPVMPEPSATIGPVGAEDTPVQTSSPDELLLPDLVVTEVLSPSSGTPGGSMNVSTRVLNKGEADAEAFTVSLFLSPDSVIREDEDLLVGLGEIESLFSGKERSGNASAPIPATIKPGTYFFGLFVDSDRIINESDENNNYAASKTPVIIS